MKLTWEGGTSTKYLWVLGKIPKKMSWGLLFFSVLQGCYFATQPLSSQMPEMKNEQRTGLVIQSDLFAMVKWPFQGVKWPSTRDEKGSLNHLGVGFWFSGKTSRGIDGIMRGENIFLKGLQVAPVVCCWIPHPYHVLDSPYFWWFPLEKNKPSPQAFHKEEG